MKDKKYTNAEIGQLADAFKNSIFTIQRWIKKNDPRLTSDIAKEALAKVKPQKK